MSSAFGAEKHCQELMERYRLPVSLSNISSEDKKYFYQKIASFFSDIPSFKVSWVDIEQVRREIPTIKFCLNTSTIPLTGSGVRQGSVYFTKERIIVLNDPKYLKVIDSIENSLLIIHETLGVLGYPDENYELTSLLWARENEEELGSVTFEFMQRELNQELETQVRRRMNIVTREGEGSGGISGVGGGGEPEVAYLKPAMITHFIANQQTFHNSCGGPENASDIVRYSLTMRLETDAEIIFDREDTGYPGLFIAHLNSKDFIQIKHEFWLTLKNKGQRAYPLRTRFINNLVLLSCALEMRYGKP